jgi:hypothetical protein
MLLVLTSGQATCFCMVQALQEALDLVKRYGPAQCMQQLVDTAETGPNAFIQQFQEARARLKSAILQVSFMLAIAAFD